MSSPGRSFGAYEIVAAIGAGGWGRCSARDTRRRRDVAHPRCREGRG